MNWDFIWSVKGTLDRKWREELNKSGLYPQMTKSDHGIMEVNALSEWYLRFQSFKELQIDLHTLFVTLLGSYYLTWVSGGEVFYHGLLTLGLLALGRYADAADNFKHAFNAFVGFFYFYGVTIYETLTQVLSLLVRCALTVSHAVYVAGNMCMESLDASLTTDTELKC